MNALPVWAPRLERDDISRLYSSEAKGLMDENLLDEVAYGLYARALSILEVTRVHTTGQITCPVCQESVHRNNPTADKQDLLTCRCGWELTWEKYFNTYQRKQLVGGSAIPIVQNAVDTFAACTTPEEKMRWIDNLIHAFHWQLEHGDCRLVASNFIDGNTAQIVELIYTLAYGEGSPEERRMQSTLWKNRLSKSLIADRVPK